MAPPDDGIQRVTVPKWGLSMETGKIIEWLVAEGDEIEEGTELATIDTDKIAGDLESAWTGVLRRIVAPAGSQVPVGATIAVVAPAGVPDAEIDAVAEQARTALESGEAAAEDTGPRTGSVAVEGRTICHASLGDGAETVVLVHGFGGDKDSWLFVQEPLARRHTVYAVDLPGHGSSTKDVGDGALTTLARTVIAVAGQAAADRVHLVGHSLGGAVAAAAAAERPDLVASLTLVAPAGLGEIDAGYLRGFTEAATRRELKPHVAKLFADPAQVTRRLVDDLLKYKRLDGVDDALHTLLGTMLDGDRQAIDTASLLKGVNVPVVTVWGAADRILPPPSRDADVIDGAGHMVHMEAPAAIVAAVEEAISRA